MEKNEGEQKKSRLLTALYFLTALVLISLLFIYWFLPRGEMSFASKGSSNFSSDSSGEMQFYSNLRYSEKEISYKIYDCPIQKISDMKRAFEIISNLSVLKFYEKNYDEEISVNCDDKDKFQEGMFIAGEGGPVNITQAGLFNVITKGKILLIRDSKCPNPNIATHELLHALGFNHSTNENNIMYSVSECEQVIGDDIPKKINELYSTESLPDLAFADVSAVMQGKYLNTNISIRNQGLKDAGRSVVKIYADGELIKEVDVAEMILGYGRIIILENIWIPQITISELEYEISYGLAELDKKNNKINLEIKN